MERSKDHICRKVGLTPDLPPPEKNEPRINQRNILDFHGTKPTFLHTTYLPSFATKATLVFAKKSPKLRFLRKLRATGRRGEIDFMEFVQVTRRSGDDLLLRAVNRGRFLSRCFGRRWKRWVFGCFFFWLGGLWWLHHSWEGMLGMVWCWGLKW